MVVSVMLGEVLNTTVRLAGVPMLLPLEMLAGRRSSSLLVVVAVAGLVLGTPNSLAVLAACRTPILLAVVALVLAPIVRV